MDEPRATLRETGLIFRNGAYCRNPVLVAALSLYPVAAAGTGLKNAAALSLLFLLTALPSQLLMCWLGMLVPKWARPAAALAATAACSVPAAFALQAVSPGAPARLGMAAALTACNSALYSRAEEYAPEHVFPAVLADALGCSAGFAAAAGAVSALRELWLTGGLWDAGSYGGGVGAGLDRPFAGFLLLGLLAALAQRGNLRRAERSGREG